MRGPSLCGKGLEISPGVGGYLALRDEDYSKTRSLSRETVSALRYKEVSRDER